MMKNNPDASFYTLELSADPGGASEYAIYALNNLEDIKSALDNSLGASGAYMTLWYGRGIRLRAYLNGVKRSDINLLPLITYQIEGYPPIGFDENGKTTGVLRERIRAELTEILWEAMTEGETSLDIRHSVNWALIDLPPLGGNILQPGERTQEAGGEIIGYGFNDLENGLFKDYGAEDDEFQETTEWENEWDETQKI